MSLLYTAESRILEKSSLHTFDWPEWFYNCTLPYVYCTRFNIDLLSFSEKEQQWRQVAFGTTQKIVPFCKMFPPKQSSQRIAIALRNKVCWLSGNILFHSYENTQNEIQIYSIRLQFKRNISLNSMNWLDSHLFCRCVRDYMFNVSFIPFLCNCVNWHSLQCNL
jgi:hypothetical protein